MPKTISDLSDAEKVCLAGYSLIGDVETAYRISRRNYNPNEPDAKNHRRLALRWLRDDACRAYLDYLKNTSPAPDGDTDADYKTDAPKFRAKEDVIREMEQLIPTLTGTDRLTALTKIADLQNMKKEDVVLQEDRIHYYLPLGSQLRYCTNCTFRSRIEELNPDLKFTDEDEGKDEFREKEK